MARKTMFVTNMFDGAKVKNTSMAVDDSHTKSNKNTISDEKRVVPTGSNPLHNRVPVYTAGYFPQEYMH
ncbi:hypothetical protein Lal_00006643 [Lupinus albus]|nr:hypothetical protein Lal_00006643 [Lupinus albus]